MNILKKAFTTSRDGLMPSVFSQLDSKMHGGGEAACHGNAPQLGTRLRTAPPQRVCDVLRKHRQHHVKACGSPRLIAARATDGLSSRRKVPRSIPNPSIVQATRWNRTPAND